MGGRRRARHDAATRSAGGRNARFPLCRAGIVCSAGRGGAAAGECGRHRRRRGCLPEPARHPAVPGVVGGGAGGRGHNHRGGPGRHPAATRREHQVGLGRGARGLRYLQVSGGAGSVARRVGRAAGRDGVPHCGTGARRLAAEQHAAVSVCLAAALVLYAGQRQLRGCARRGGPDAAPHAGHGPDGGAVRAERRQPAATGVSGPRRRLLRAQAAHGSRARLGSGKHLAPGARPVLAHGRPAAHHQGHCPRRPPARTLPRR